MYYLSYYTVNINYYKILTRCTQNVKLDIFLINDTKIAKFIKIFIL